MVESFWYKPLRTRPRDWHFFHKDDVASSLAVAFTPCGSCSAYDGPARALDGCSGTAFACLCGRRSMRPPAPTAHLEKPADRLMAQVMEMQVFDPGPCTEPIPCKPQGDCVKGKGFSAVLGVRRATAPGDKGIVLAWPFLV
jgi:hypothetical protein